MHACYSYKSENRAGEAVTADALGTAGGLLWQLTMSRGAQASVQLTGDDMRVETVRLDDIAEFVGRHDDVLD